MNYDCSSIFALHPYKLAKDGDLKMKQSKSDWKLNNPK